MRAFTIGRLMTISALVYALLGLAFLFLTEEMETALGLPGGANVLVAMWSAALLGFASMNWASRASILGGIYGRAIVVGNQTHATVGLIVLINQALGTGAEVTPLSAVTVFAYALQAALFGFLMLHHPMADAASRT